MTATTTTPSPAPEWVDARRVALLFSLARSTVYRLAEEGHITTVSLREGNNLRGKRLFSVQSIRDYIESKVVKPKRRE